MEICSLCGRPAQQLFIDVKTKTIYCGHCAPHISHCPTCANLKTCLFETDPSPAPKLIQKQIKQGNMIMTTQVKNPDRIRITCQTGCPCFSNENTCLREFNHCGSYVFINEKKNEENCP